MPLILGAQSATGAADIVTNSCMFVEGDSPVLSLSQASGTSTKTLTVSMWFKRGGMGTSDYGTLWSTGTGTADGMQIAFYQDELVTESWDGSVNPKIQTDRVFRDPTAWYHLCMVWDTTESVAADRMRLYINGTELSNFSADVNPTLNYDIPGWSGSGDTVSIGKEVLAGSWEYFDGYLAEVCCLDGQALGPTSFGEFNEDSPTIWQPIDVSGLTFGTNGFYLDFKDSANLGNDAAGSNDLTETNIAAANQMLDNPQNNFCVMNPLVSDRTGFTWSYGNTKVVTGTVDNSGSTMGFTSGKWYYEIYTDTRGNAYPGWQDLFTIGADTPDSYTPIGFVGINPGITYNSGSGAVFTSFKGVAGAGDGWVSTDYLGLAIDMDNLTCWWSLNGQWYTADDATATTLTRAQVSSNTNGFDLTTGSLFSAGAANRPPSMVAPCMGCSTATCTTSFNFGDGQFAGTALTGTTYTDNNSQGIFKYEPPDGFRAICSKNIGEFG